MDNFLYLEDDEDDMFLFDKALNEIQGTCNVLYASSCFDVMQILDKHTPDVILLDINVPGTSGIECLKLIRAEPKWERIPIVMYSTQVNKQWINEANLQRADMYLKKPEHFEKVKDTLKELLKLDLRRQGGPYSFKVMI